MNTAQHLPARRLARVVLAASLLLCLFVALAVGVHATASRAPADATTLPLPTPARLPASVIVVAAPDADSAAPAAGVTGTTTLPALPVTAAMASAIAAGDTGVTPARAFSLGRATALDRARALECLTAAIHYEAASEPDAGQRAVAQVVLNRARHPAFPASVCGVVYHGSERAGCQFSFACDGAMARVPSRQGWARAARTAGAALAGYVYAPVGLATHYHTYAVTPAWNRSLVMTNAVGAHFFHRWKGYWGTATAFRRGYAGGEPLPGPHARIEPPVQVAVVAALVMPPEPSLPDTGRVRPDWRDSGTPLVAAPPTLGQATTDTAAADSQILPRWKDSGQPVVR